METKQSAVEAVMMAAPVIPVVVIDDVAAAVSLARALVAGGIPAIEVTLRTPRALECLAAIAGEVEGALPGAGTVLTRAQVEAVERAGAKFMVSPGAAANLLDAAADSALPLLPGAATASEVMALAESGYRHLKFFPAAQAGGPAYLGALASPLPHVRFCPTGGISAANAADYLAQPNVLCVGGSWLAPAKRIAEQDWTGITGLAREAAALSR
ncbi:MAG: bifunctional 4-hydroxy-2-oxoglutarate aldolase/2-dehydro-3-deoxy-phosphogluconate aldolase [Pseudomonadota bacterium]|nr:bifunctional 4-hydroxy-2-oxoglutarate aldolase/2-dehydro-3-deoxy-phosphogluconate aldolase [Pseudomonadota bacterium]